MKTLSTLTILWIALGTALSGCQKKIGWTTVRVRDSIRHYYPVIAGQILNISYEIENTGDEPLIIRDIQPSCGCIVPELKTRMVVPQKKKVLLFKYESAKNIGHVEHVIRIHCNANQPTGIVKLIFDVNVVPPADYTPDYEELYKEAVERNNIIRGLVDGDESEKGYYIDTPAQDSRAQKKYPWIQEEPNNQ